MDHGFRKDACSWIFRDPFVYSCIYRNDLFKTPVSTPRRLRRSISQGDVSISQSPILKPEDLVESEVNEPHEVSEEVVDRLRARVAELEEQLNDAMDKLVMSEPRVDHPEDGGAEARLKTRVEQLETELETCRAELRLRDQDVEKAEKLAEELDSLKVCWTNISFLTFD